MNILYLNSRLPEFAEHVTDARNYALLKHVSQHHNITVVVVSENNKQPSLDHLQKFCDSYYQIQQKRIAPLQKLKDFFNNSSNHSLGLDFKALRKTLERLLTSNAFDMIHCGHAALVHALPKQNNIPVLLQLDSISPEIFIQQLLSDSITADLDHQKIHSARSLLHAAWENVDHIIVPTEKMKRHIQSYTAKTDITIVPPGVDTNYYVNNGSVNAMKTIVLSGAFNQKEDRDAIRNFIRQMWGRLQRRDRELRLFIVGNGASEEMRELNRLKNIYVATEVKDTRQIVREATAVIFPHQQCEFVNSHVLEAMAQSKAVIATQNAVAGLHVVDGQNIAIATTADAFAEKIITISNDEFQRRIISLQARAAVEAFHSWEVVARPLLQVYRKLISGIDPGLEQKPTRDEANNAIV